MITCRHARHLFDTYLDGELSPSLQAELHAHQLNCSDCQGELALLEACGDVVAYDRGEPTVNAAFTDRVLLAYRAQARPAPRRHWGRLILTVSSPEAAAAAIALAVLLIAPTGKEASPGLVAGERTRVPDSVKDILLTFGGKEEGAPKSPTARQMPAGFVDVMLAPWVEQTRKTVDGTRRSVERLDSLLRLGIAGATEAFAASGRAADAVKTVPEAVHQPKPVDPNPLDPSFLHQAPTVPQPGPEVDDTVEAL
ncbi:MAG: zf-HC2 domain-containing protein [Planctomycetes bacterium]|nr:zf-HC2 domain-containing protein [Planctomycetota bacterium]